MSSVNASAVSHISSVNYETIVIRQCLMLSNNTLRLHTAIVGGVYLAQFHCVAFPPCFANCVHLLTTFITEAMCFFLKSLFFFIFLPFFSPADMQVIDSDTITLLFSDKSERS